MCVHYFTYDNLNYDFSNCSNIHIKNKCQYSSDNYLIIRFFSSLAEIDRYLLNKNCAKQIKKSCENTSLYFNSYWRLYKESDKIGDLLSI